jgi:hypothetical protein
LCLGKKRETAKKNGVVRISWIGEMNLNVAFPDGSGLSSGSLKVANDGHGSVEPFGPRRPVLVSVNLLKIYSAQVGRDASGLSSRRELFNGTRLPGDQHSSRTCRSAQRCDEIDPRAIQAPCSQ